MRTAAIMQPTYLPWMGYFDLMDQSDVFVFLDSVQFDKRSWQQRNRIKTPTGELMLTVPVSSKANVTRQYVRLKLTRAVISKRNTLGQFSTVIAKHLSFVHIWMNWQVY